ncbi:hypothetical protein [Gluconobacter cadivus]|uniref:Lipoprotein n=1 Tax=Gluconobacter cadivus TaxID=2728101 RepID=A0ABR9YZP7_9PROT|nr:hypothetical protein [Gluconobacter cadivus]MBF0889641.1 hypothetical protein [Gluconobacter cadivus]
MNRYLPALIAVFSLAACAAPTTYHFGVIAPADENYCKLEADKYAGPPSESLMGTLNQMKYRNNLTRDCLLAKGYKLFPDRK